MGVNNLLQMHEDLLSAFGTCGCEWMTSCHVKQPQEACARWQLICAVRSCLVTCLRLGMFRLVSYS